MSNIRFDPKEHYLLDILLELQAKEKGNQFLGTINKRVSTLMPKIAIKLSTAASLKNLVAKYVKHLRVFMGCTIFSFSLVPRDDVAPLMAELNEEATQISLIRELEREGKNLVYSHTITDPKTHHYLEYVAYTSSCASRPCSFACLIVVGDAINLDAGARMALAAHHLKAFMLQQESWLHHKKISLLYNDEHSRAGINLSATQQQLKFTENWFMRLRKSFEASCSFCSLTSCSSKAFLTSTNPTFLFLGNGSTLYHKGVEFITSALRATH